jgi:hypothetical protein
MSRKHWIEQRRAILLEIINEQPEKRWSRRQVHEAMKRHPMVREIQPDYSLYTAHTDYVSVFNEIKDRREQLADDYITMQLEIAGYFIDDLLKEYENLNEIDPEWINDVSVRADFVLDRIDKKTKLQAGVERMFKRIGTLVPTEIPKQLQIDQRQVVMTIDRFQQLAKESSLMIGSNNNNKQLSASSLGSENDLILDGEFVNGNGQ